MVRPERRTRADLTAVALIVVTVLVGSVAIWVYSDARATVIQPAAEPASPVRHPATVPSALEEVWRAPSAATPEPVVAGPTAVTAEGSEVLGRNPVTGEVRWRYARGIELCTVGAEWGRAIAVYRKSDNCSEVTSLQGASGERGPQRNSAVGTGTRLLSDGTNVTATGRQLFVTWRSDLVRTQIFGIPTAITIPDNNLRRPKCEYSSIAVGDGRVGVIEECPNTAQDRITVIRARPDSSEQPEAVFSTVVGGSEAGVVAVNDRSVAVVLHERSELVVYDFSSGLRARFPVRVSPHAPSSGVRIESTTLAENVYWSRDGRTVQGGVYWHTGSTTVALDPVTLTPLWTVPDTLGSGTVMAGKLLIPVPAGIAVHDPNTGDRLRVVPVDRGSYRGPVSLDTVGDVVLEQREDTVVALR